MLDGAPSDATETSEDAGVPAADGASGPASTAPACAPGLQPGSPWPMQGRCTDRSSLAATAGPDAPVVSWIFDDGVDNWAAPSIAADGTLYATGSLIRPDGSKKGEYTDHGGPVTIAADGSLYGGGDGGDLLAYGPDGTHRWSVSLHILTGGVDPAIGPDGTAYVGTSAFSLYAVSPKGKVLWKKDQASFQSGLTYDTAAAVAADGTIYWAAGTLHALRPDGSVIWELSRGPDGFAQTPTIGRDGTIYAGRRTWPASAYIVDAVSTDGTLKWSLTRSGVDCVAPIALGPDGTLHVACGASVWAIDADGKAKWAASSWGGVSAFSVPTVDAAGTVYVVAGSDDGGFYAFNADGTPKWRHRVDGGSPGGVSIGADGTLYGACGHFVYAFAP